MLRRGLYQLINKELIFISQNMVYGVQFKGASDQNQDNKVYQKYNNQIIQFGGLS